MQYTFSSEAASAEAFFSFTSVGMGAIFCMTLAALILLWDRSRPLHIKAILALSLSGIACVSWAGYETAFGRFFSVETHDKDFRLQYAGPFAHEVNLPHDTIDTVLFGAPAKWNHRCYLKILTKPGQTYRSATVDVPLDTCKKLRETLLRAVAGSA